MGESELTLFTGKFAPILALLARQHSGSTMPGRSSATPNSPMEPTMGSSGQGAP